MALHARRNVAGSAGLAAPTPADLQGMALAVVASSPDCIKIVSAEGRIEYLSEGGRVALELDCGGPDLLGSNWLELWDVEIRPTVTRALEAARGGELARFEALATTHLGTAKWWDVTVSPLRSVARGPTKLLVISRDITASRNAAAALMARVDRQELLYRLSGQLLRAGSEAEMLRAVVGLAPGDLGIEACLALAAEPGKAALSLCHAHGFSADQLVPLQKLDFGSLLCGRVAATQRPVIVSGLQNSSDPACDAAARLGLTAFAGFPLLSPNGDLFGVLSFGSRQRLTFGTQDVSLLGAIADMYATVALRLRVERALRESEDSLRLLLDGARDHAIFKLDRDGRIASWNEGAERLHGFPAAQVLGRPLACLYDEADRAAGLPADAIERATRDGKTPCAGIRIRKDGSRFAVSGTLSALYDGDGAVIGFAKVMQDISARVDQENALKTSESRLRAVFETAVDGIVVIDVGGTIHSFNRAAERMFGYHAAEMIGTTVDVLMSPSAAIHHDRAMARYLASGVARVIGLGREVYGRRRDGSDFPLELSIAEWRDATGELFFTGIMRDLSERKMAERARREANEAVLRASRLTALGAMASTIAHELNQPLTAMANYMSATQIALTAIEPTPTVAINTLDRALGSVRRVGEIISRMRSFAKNGQIHARAVALAPIIDEAWDKVRHCSPAAGVSFKRHAGADALMVRADRTQIEQVMINLMRNAVEAMVGLRRRRLTVEARRNGANVEIAISDTGPGLAPERLKDPARLFSSTKPEGTGLGLPVCATIIEAHGGRLSAEPMPGGGAKFIVTLPLVGND